MPVNFLTERSVVGAVEIAASVEFRVYCRACGKRDVLGMFKTAEDWATRHGYGDGKCRPAEATTGGPDAR